jgi:hypothetical protein
VALAGIPGYASIRETVALVVTIRYLLGVRLPVHNEVLATEAPPGVQAHTLVAVAVTPLT